MKFILFVEGHTEQKALPEFLKRWLDIRLDARAGIETVRFEGWPEVWRETPRRAERYLSQPGGSDEIIAVVALLDLYGPTIYPDEPELHRWVEQKQQSVPPGEAWRNCTGPVGGSVAATRYEWAKRIQEQKVGQARFRQFFAVHETEAWLLSERSIFPTEIRRRLPNKHPEEVNFTEPPAACLDRIYRSAVSRHYRKVTDGRNLFRALDPSTAYERCPSLKTLLDEMLALARNAGL